jgi:hypothetical protein
MKVKFNLRLSSEHQQAVYKNSILHSIDLINKKNESRHMTHLKANWTSLGNADASIVEASVEESGTAVHHCLLSSGGPVDIGKQVDRKRAQLVDVAV